MSLFSPLVSRRVLPIVSRNSGLFALPVNKIELAIITCKVVIRQIMMVLFDVSMC